MSPNEHSGKNKLFSSHSDFTPPSQSQRSAGEVNNRHVKKASAVNYVNKRKIDEYERMQASMIDKNWDISKYGDPLLQSQDTK